MAKILLEVNDHKEFKKGDMLIFDGRTFVAVRKEHILSDIPKLYEKIEELSKKVAILEATIKYDHGQISQEEYERLCGGNN